MTNKTLKIFYGLIFLTSFFVSTVFTTYVPFLAERSMSRLEINLINAFFMLSVFLMEVPTGSYADSWGRKRCFLYSLLFEAVSFAVYYLSNSFLFFVLAEVLAAVAWAFASGSLEAWLVDSLKHHGFNGELTKVFYRESVFHQSGFILGGLAGAYVGARFNLALPWLLASVGSLFCFILATFLMKEEYFVRKKLNGFKQKSN